MQVLYVAVLQVAVTVLPQLSAISSVGKCRQMQ
jgi:hypothetical protein